MKLKESCFSSITASRNLFSAAGGESLFLRTCHRIFEYWSTRRDAKLFHKMESVFISVFYRIDCCPTTCTPTRAGTFEKKNKIERIWVGSLVGERKTEKKTPKLFVLSHSVQVFICLPSGHVLAASRHWQLFNGFFHPAYPGSLAPAISSFFHRNVLSYPPPCVH